jgi:hypothetical protein
MAGRILDRRELRAQTDEAERQEAANGGAEGAGTGETPPKKGSKAKKPTAPKARKSRAKKAPPRLFARWGVFDGGMKQVAIFPYNQRDAAEKKLGELLAKQKGVYFLQIVKEAMPEPEPAAVLQGE